MADPLSVAASIACLLSLAGQVYTTLDKFISNVQNTPSFANRIRVEVDSFRSSLNAFDTLLSSWTAPPRRAVLIPADFIVLTLTDATLLFSEIEAEVLPLVLLKEFDFLARAKWTLKKKQLESLVSRLQWQKLTLVLQLNILKCASDNEAHRDVATLTQHCIQKLADNQDLERCLALIEAQLQAPALGDIESMTNRSSQSHCLDETATARNSGAGILDAYPIHHEFEETLYASWVYRRNEARGGSMSARSSVIPESRWSPLSELSLAQLSVISVIALPVQRLELFNARWYAPFETQGEEANEYKEGGRPVVGSKIQPIGSAQGSQHPVSCEEQNGSSTTGAEGFATTVEETEVTLHEVSDSDIAEMEILLQGAANTLPEITKKLEETHIEPTVPAMIPISMHTILSKALQKANIAVLRDNAQDYSGAIDSYMEACNLLEQVIARSEIWEDLKKLESIRNTYFSRMIEPKMLNIAKWD